MRSEILELLKNGNIEQAKNLADPTEKQLIEQSIQHTSSEQNYVAHYSNDNGRVPGAFVHGLDARQFKAKEFIGTVTSLLDLGSADGSFLINCADQIHLTGIGVDLWISGVNFANLFCCNRTYNHLRFIVGMYESISFPLQFDCIHAGEILEHVLDLDKVLDKIKLDLKPNGKLVITVPSFRDSVSEEELKHISDGNINEHIRHLTPEIIKAKLADRHFKIEKETSVIIGSWHNYVGCFSSM